MHSIFITEQEGFGVPVANLLFAPSTPAFVLPAPPCAEKILSKAYALKLLQEHFGSNPFMLL